MSAPHQPGAPATWEITAVRYGTLPSTRGRLFHRWDVYGDPDGPQALDYFFYVLRSAGRTLLVDCGFWPQSGERRGRTCLVAPREALARVGVELASVARVLVTHLHYDHIGNLDAFPHAELVVPARELSFWTDPLAREPHFWSHVDGEHVARVVTARREGRVVETAGRTQIEPGIELVEVGGHSPGQQLLVVETATGPVLLASDAVHLYEELERRRPFAVFVDLEEMYRGFETVRALERARGAVVVPGHDPLVAERFADLGGEAAGIGLAITGGRREGP